MAIYGIMYFFRNIVYVKLFCLIDFIYQLIDVTSNWSNFKIYYSSLTLKFTYVIFPKYLI